MTQHNDHFLVVAAVKWTKNVQSRVFHVYHFDGERYAFRAAQEYTKHDQLTRYEHIEETGKAAEWIAKQYTAANAGSRVVFNEPRYHTFALKIAGLGSRLVPVALAKSDARLTPLIARAEARAKELVRWVNAETISA